MTLRRDEIIALMVEQRNTRQNLRRRPYRVHPGAIKNRCTLENQPPTASSQHRSTMATMSSRAAVGCENSPTASGARKRQQQQQPEQKARRIPSHVTASSAMLMLIMVSVLMLLSVRSTLAAAAGQQNEQHVHHQLRAQASSSSSSPRWTIEELLHAHFATKISDDIDLDPCKSGELFSRARARYAR